MKKSLILFAALLVCAATASAQKKALSHDIYSSWKTISGEAISDDGKAAFYTVAPQLGNPTTVIYTADNGKKTEIKNARGASFFNNQKWITYTILTDYDSTRQAKIDKLSKDKMPKNGRGFIEIATGRKVEIPKAGQGSAAESAPIIAYRTQEKEDTSAKSKMIDLMIALDISSGDTLLRVKNINKFEVSKFGEVVYSTLTKDSLEALWVWQAGELTKIFEDRGKDVIGQVVLDKKNGRRFAYTMKTDKENDRYTLYDVPLDGLIPEEVGFSADGLVFSNLDPVSYSKQGNLLHFSIATPPVKKKETVPDDEKFTLDVWSYTDTLIQTQQLAQKKKWDNHTFAAVYDIAAKQSRRLTRTMYEDVAAPQRDDTGVFLIVDNAPYNWSMTWSATPKRRDIYAYFPKENKREPLIEAQRGVFSLSPRGEWVAYYNMEDSTWYSRNVRSKAVHNLSAATGQTFFTEEFDYPSTPPSYGFGGWVAVSKGKQKAEYALIYDRYDIWMVDPAGKAAPRRLTDGRPDKKTFRIEKTDPDAVYANEGNALLLSSFNNANKYGGLHTIAVDKAGNISKTVRTLADTPNRYVFKCKAKNADRMLWTRESYTEFPDLQMSDMRLADAKKISDANPEMKEYLWGSAQLIKWTDSKGRETEGMLYLPEGYDPDKKYPTLLYFYERINDVLYGFRHPTPSRSSLVIPMCTSNNYVVLIPDIVFGTGHPGKTGTQVVVDAANELKKRGIADPERIGLQGQSWAGYLINYIVTQTDMFCCANAGAGVANMTSAYTGIRSGTGITRMVQYETGQSRIGATLWEAPELYIENSPLFYLPNVNTPLLLRHSDNDEAVPFSQSIEMFSGLRRLGKPVWLLNYHGEFHNMKKIVPRIDWSIRMMQFFDHYMKDAPAPRWMVEGVRIDERGKDAKLELAE